MKLNKLTLLLTLTTTLMVTACSNNAANNGNSSPSPTVSSSGAKQTVVKVATSSVPFPALYNIDDKGNTSGYVVDYFKILEERLPEYKFQYEPADINGQLIGTETGKYDIAGWVWFKNAERQEKYVFSEPFGYSPTVLTTKKERNDIHSLDDVVNKKLVPMTPNSGLRSIILEYNRQHPGKEIAITDVDKFTIAGDLKMVASGQYDVDYKNLAQVEAVNKELNLGLKVAAVITKEPIYFLFNKKQGELAEKIGKITKELKENGTLSKLSEKWYGFDVYKDTTEIQQYLTRGN
ncbi:transporter substrate-binding domain-containing protein [Paenibacillus periandrae]|uniref:transporter substrate-binding domain-containing protein n=1 Tax=Paenibacillus periandrae TaxID=1761741 RepID=UPI001F092A0B|nr:transporter substrate-binding domain-containing protein [Paenibacillus periandrae]